MKNEFPSLEKIKQLGKEKIIMFTNGKTIYTNLYSKAFYIEPIELSISIAYVHGMIHCMDMNMSEREAFNFTRAVVNAILKNMD